METLAEASADAEVFWSGSLLERLFLICNRAILLNNYLCSFGEVAVVVEECGMDSAITVGLICIVKMKGRKECGRRGEILLVLAIWY